MEIENNGIVEEDDSGSKPNSFVGFCQICSNKTATNLESSVVVATLVHIALMNVSEG